MMVAHARLLVLLALVLVVSPAVAEDVTTTVRVFHLRHASVLDASLVVQPLLSEAGSLTLQPHQSKLTVQDRPEVVVKVAEALRTLDRQPDLYRVRVELLEGASEAVDPRQQARVDDRLRRMFRFASFRRLGAANFEGEMGDRAVANLGMDYRISFVADSLGISEDSPWGIPNPGTRLQLQGLVLERASAEGDSESQNIEVLRTRVVLSVNQEVFIGAGGSEDSSTGLVLILKALSVGER